VSSRVITAFKPASRIGESMRALRSQLMIRWFPRVPHRPALTIAGVGRTEGRSFVTANLAVAFAQNGQRTLLIDADLRNPIHHTLFRIRRKRGLAAILAGRASIDAVVDIQAVPGLSVLPAGALPPNPQELLARPSFDTLLAELAERFSVILIDTSVAADSADSQWIARRTRGALMVARRDHTSFAQLNDLDATLRQADVLSVAMARLLVPGDFGIVAIAGAMVGLGMAVLQRGLPDAPVQAHRLDDRQVRSAFALISSPSSP
jgi:protein-tyrosine kinase